MAFEGGLEGQRVARPGEPLSEVRRWRVCALLSGLRTEGRGSWQVLFSGDFPR
jgi:hypothetical protein